MFEFTDDILMEATEFLLQHPDFVDLIDDSSNPDTYIHPPKATRKRGKIRFSTDYSQTNWGKFIADPRVREPQSKEGKLFRRRFLVPFTTRILGYK
jgi:hypothetical protein